MLVTFPKDFLWGGATSGPQTEGRFKKKHDSVFDYDFDHYQERFWGALGPDTASNFFHDFKEDIRLMKEAGLKSLRTSIQWTRLIDDFEKNTVNEQGLAFYNAVIDECLAQGIRPMLNLNHFDLPMELMERYGGWESRHVVDLYAKFASVCFQAFSDRVVDWFTFNEPMVVVECGYLLGFHYPDLAVGQGYKTPGNVDYVLGNGLPFAVDVTGDGKKIQNVYDIPSYVENLKLMHEYYTKGLIPADAATSSTAYDLNSNNWFARIETQGPYDYGDTILTQAAGQELVSKPLTESLITTDQARVANFVVSNTSKHKKEAVQVLGLINSNEKLLNTLVYGIEGKQWEKTGDKKIKTLKSYSEGVTHMPAWNTGNNALLYTTDAVTDEMIAKRDESIKNASVSPLLGFTFDQSKVKSEISNLSNVMSQYLDQLNTGSVDPTETLPKLKDDLKKAGFDKVQKEMQAQYDDYLKSKESN